MCFISPPIVRTCSKENAIPDQVLVDILNVYRFGRKEDIPKLPNNLICQIDGSFWTTWDRVLEIRDQHELYKEEEND